MTQPALLTCPTCGSRVPAAAPPPTPYPAPAPALPAYPAPPAAQPAPQPAALPAPRRGLRTASVPAVLLGLGALCLLVAAVAFLAVAWSALGVGGRTAVLVGLTGATAGLGAWLGRRGLRVGAESLSVVSLGLLVLDLVGADSAGWLGATTGPGLTWLVATVLALAALAWLPTGLLAPQVLAPLALGVAAAAAAAETGHPYVVATAATLVLAGAAALGGRVGARLLPWTAGTAAAACWAWLALGGLVEAAASPSLAGLWADRHALPLVAAAALLAGPARWYRPALAGTATILTLLALLPAVDEGTTALALAGLAALAGWTAVGHLARTGRTALLVLPMALAAAAPLGVAVGQVAEAALRVLLLAPPLSQRADVALPGTADVAHPALLVPTTLVVLAAGAVASGRRVPVVVAAAAVGVAAVATVALLPVPLAALVGVLALAGPALVRRHLLAGLLPVAAVVAALPSDVLTAAALAALVATCALVLRHVVAAAVLPLAVAGLVWTALEVAGVDPSYRGVPVLLAVGLLALALPRPELETSAVLVGTVAAVAAVSGPTSLAVHLTVLGALTSAHAVLHHERRRVGWAGGLLLAAATWVRLADLGVSAPEAYTLPSAVALLLVGLAHLRRDPDAPTGPALTPGLVLATVPSLLWVLAVDPVSLRAALLGAACLALVLAGTSARWSAPVVVGGVVGAALVLRELAPYAATVPQWALIGAAGTALTVVGVTWERRLQEVRSAQSWVARLR